MFTGTRCNSYNGCKIRISLHEPHLPLYPSMAGLNQSYSTPMKWLNSSLRSHQRFNGFLVCACLLTLSLFKMHNNNNNNKTSLIIIILVPVVCLFQETAAYSLHCLITITNKINFCIAITYIQSQWYFLFCSSCIGRNLVLVKVKHFGFFNLYIIS